VRQPSATSVGGAWRSPESGAGAVGVEGGIGGGEIGTWVGEAAAGSDGVDVCCGLMTSSMAGTRGGGPVREAHR
jgi:hypothetical protein